MRVQISSYLRFVIICLAAFIFAGCINSAAIENHELSVPVLKKVTYIYTNGSESSLPLVHLRLGAGRLTAEVASTTEQHLRGLAFRATLKADFAMLFTYPAPHKVAFYMKDTYIPLSVAYIDSMGTVIEMYDLIPGVETPVISKSSGIRFVLEVNHGWFEKNGIVPGTRIYVENEKTEPTL